MAVLANGFNVVIKQKVGSVNTPIYPFTKAANVIDAAGDDVEATLAALKALYHVPTPETGVTESLRFLRSDNTWQTIQDATTAQKGVTQLSSDYTSAAAPATDETTAATTKAVKEIYSAVSTIGSTYVAKADVAFGGPTVMDTDDPSVVAVQGVATLDTNGLVPAAQLPSYVDDVIEAYYNEDDGKFYSSKTPGAEEGDPATYTGEITPEANKIYINLDNNKTYRWGGSVYVIISETLAIGTTSSTAFAGDRGLALETYNQNTLPVVSASSNNGYIQIAPGTTGTAVDTLVYDITAETSIAGTSDNTGAMSNAQAKKLDGTMEISISDTEPTFSNASATNLWIEVVSDDTEVSEPEEP
jgi:hypothetical protein